MWMHNRDNGTQQAGASWWCAGLLGAALLVGCGTQRTVTVRTIPTGADVWVNGSNKGQSPWDGTLRWTDEKPSMTISAVMIGYETARRTYTQREATQKSSAFDVDLTLPPLHHNARLQLNLPDGAQVWLDDQPAETGSGHIPLHFTRRSSSGKWSTHSVKVRYQDHCPKAINGNPLAKGQDARGHVATLKQSQCDASGLIVLNIEFEPLVWEVPVHLNVPTDAAVWLRGKEVRTGPGTEKISFSRSNNAEPWGTCQVQVRYPKHFPTKVDGHPLEPGRDEAPYVGTLAMDDRNGQGEIALQVAFDRVRVVRTVLTEVVLGNDGLEVRERSVFADTMPDAETEQSMGKVSPITNFRGDDFVVTRLSTDPISGDVIAAIPQCDSDGHINAMQLRQWSAGQMTEEELTNPMANHDMHPAYTGDGKTIYFTSDREVGHFNIWSIEGAQAYGMATHTANDGYQDIEPSTNPVTNAVAFTSVDMAGEAPRIKIMQQGVPTFVLGPGRSPDWSPDGTTLLWVDRDRQKNRDKLMTWKRGSRPVKHTDAKRIEGVRWHPDGQHIIYAAPQDAVDPITHEDNFDVWVFAVDGANRGEKRQLTANRSYDTYPVPTFDGNYLYFISNREAGRGLDSGDWQIYRMAWPFEWAGRQPIEPGSTAIGAVDVE